MFRQSKTLEFALCGLVLMVVVGFGFQAVDADVDKETMLQLERIAQQSAQQATQQPAQPQSIPDTSFSLIPENELPVGITYYNDKFWIVDALRKKVYAYNTNGTYDSSASFLLASENNVPAGITYGDGKFWVVNQRSAFIGGGSTGIVYVYNLDGTLTTAFQLISTYTSATGITYHDGKLWVVEFFDGEISAYNTNGTYDSSASFLLASENNDPGGITYGDGKFWVAGTGIYAYSTDGRTKYSDSFSPFSVNDVPSGITYHDGKLWVVDLLISTVYIYSLQESETDPDASLESRITDLETKMTNLKTLLTDMQTTLSSLETTIKNLNTRIVALENGMPAPDPQPVITTGVSGKVYTDSNNNGTLDAGESGVSGRSVIAVNLTDQTDVSRTSTDVNGDYSFDIMAGGYLVQVEGTNAYAYVTVLDGSVLTQNLGI